MPYPGDPPGPVASRGIRVLGWLLIILGIAMLGIVLVIFGIV
jgi:hypothetical protein